MLASLLKLDDLVGGFLTRTVFDRFGPVGETVAEPRVRSTSEGSSVAVSRAAGGRQDRARNYRILLDEVQVGELRAGETWSGAVTPGMHTLWLKHDWTGSARATFSVGVGDVASYHCAAYDIGLSPVAQWRAYLRRAPWIELTRPGGNEASNVWSE